MKLIYDHQIFYWQKYGGISRYFYELASRVGMNKSIDTTILAPFYVNEYIKKIRGAKLVGVYVPSGRVLNKFYKLAGSTITNVLVKKMNPDIVHETYYTPCKYSNAKSKRVLTVFDMIHEKFPEYFPSCDKTKERKARAVESADHIICISENTKKDLISCLGVRDEKVSVIHLGFSLTSKLETNLKPILERPYILYVGQRSGYKNFLQLLKVYSSHNDINSFYDLVTFGGGKVTSKEVETLMAYGLNENKLHNFSGSDDTLENLYRNASIFVYPSLYEGFGIPPLEAMSFGCPVVCSNRSSIPEVVGNAARFFDPDLDTSLYKSIIEVLNNVELRKFLVEKGFERVMSFSWDVCASKTTEVYKRLLG